MFVKNIVDVAVSDMQGNVTALNSDGTGNIVFDGVLKNTPYVLLNEKVTKLEISLGKLSIYISE